MEYIVIVGIVLLVIVLRSSLVMVTQGYKFTVERLGEYKGTLEPGLTFIIPFFDRIGAKINMKEQVLDIQSQDVITRDNAMVRTDGVVFFKILEPQKAAYAITDLEASIVRLVQTNIRTVMGSMEMDELLSQRDAINIKLLSVMDDATGPWGVKVTRVEIRDIAPPQNMVEAMARQMKAERDKRAVILEAEGIKQAEILKADGLKQATILNAEGLKEAAYREAEARERQGQAEAKATEVVSRAVENGSLQALSYFIGLKSYRCRQQRKPQSNRNAITSCGR